MLFQKEKMILMILTIVLFAVSTTSAPFQAQAVNDDVQSATPTLTVCEALSHASEYDGKIVRIRGTVYGTDEGAWFFGKDCPGIYVTEGKVWPSTIAWTGPTQLTFIIHPINFSFDPSSRQRIEKKWGRLQKHLPDSCIAVTYTGLFESWSKEKARKTDPEGHVYEIPGFGHLNSAPAQLVLKSADDVEPIPNCKASKSGKDTEAIKKK
jgi:hypothetical protein